jgi:hypothetical protein
MITSTASQVACNTQVAPASSVLHVIVDSNHASTIMGFTPDDFNKIILPIITLIALVAGALVQLWIAKRQSEMQKEIAKRQIADSISARRQAWINELRSEASEYLTLVARIEELKRPAPNLSLEDQKRNFDDMAAANARGHELGVLIRLRLNPLEEMHNTLTKLLTNLADVCVDPPPNETQSQVVEAKRAFFKARNDVIVHLQKILKYEWERVKRGEV